MRDNEFTKILGWPGYRVFWHEIDRTAKRLRLWVRRKQGDRKLVCSGCGDHRSVSGVLSAVRVEKVPQLPSKAPFGRVSSTLECGAAQGPLVQMGVDEIYFGKQMKFITAVSNLDTGELLWFGQDRKQETLDEFFRT
jgi:hypothetical protein